MKKLLPRNTTIPVRRSDTFSTGENNQTVVEIHVLQGEREMASGNKSLGRFKLTGIPPAPRGVPQIQVSFDIDANGILQVTARDKTTGREQGITVQGASNLSETEINRMMKDAAEFAEQDRERRERVEKRNAAKALADQAQRRLKEVTLDFGSQFAGYYRRRIDILCEEILDSLKKDDDRSLDRSQADLQDVLYELNREVRLLYEEEEDDDFFGAIRKTFLGDEDDKVIEDYSYDTRRGDYRDSYNYSSYQDQRRNPAYPPSNSGYPQNNNSYPQDDYKSSPKSNGYRDSYPDNYSEPPRSPADYPPDNYRSSPRSNGYRDSYPDNYSEPPLRPADYPPDSYDSPRRNAGRGEPPYSSRYPNAQDGVEQRYYKGSDRSRPIPYQNDWDEEDDEWF